MERSGTDGAVCGWKCHSEFRRWVVELSGVHEAANPTGSINAHGCIHSVSYPTRGKEVVVLCEAAGILVFDERGKPIVEHLWLPPGIKYVATASAAGRRRTKCHPCPETSHARLGSVVSQDIGDGPVSKHR